MADRKQFNFPSEDLRQRLSQFLTVRGDELELEDIRLVKSAQLEHLANAIANAQGITSIILNYTITDEQYNHIARALLQNLNLRKIEISTTNLHAKITCLYDILTRPGAIITKLAFFDTKLTSKDVELLCEGLKCNNSLTTLDLMCNDFGVEGCIYLSEALRRHKTIKYLSLVGNLISVEGCKHISSILKENTSLTYLDLATNSLGSESMKYLAEALHGNNTLKHLVIYNNEIRDEGCIYLSTILDTCTSLQELDIAVNDITALGLAELSKSLKHNNSLLYFLASVNRCGVMLQTESVSTIGYEALCSALEHNTSLTVLDLSRNPNLGSCLPFLEKMLQVNRSLLEVKLRGSQWLISEVSPTDRISEALKRNHTSRKQQVLGIITVLLNMGRQTSALEIFPLEIWLTIFKHFQMPGISSFETISRSILFNAHNIVETLRSGSKIRIVINDEAEMRMELVNTNDVNRMELS